MRGVLSSKGQITVPAKVRKALGLRAGTPVEFELRPGGALLRRRVDLPDPADQVYGILRGLPAVDQLIEELRGPGLDAVTSRRRRLSPGQHRAGALGPAPGRKRKPGARRRAVVPAHP